MPSSPPEQRPIAELPALPLAAPELRPERADAALNRQRILCAAGRLFKDRGVERVTMHDVAREAQVGVGTLYRRFGDRSGLALALLDEAERAFQDRILRGAPPLGPGAPAAERLQAFGRRYLAFLDGHAELIATAQPPGVLLGGPFDVHRTHIALLLREAAPGIDVEYATEVLLTALNAALHLHLRRDRGYSLERVQDGWCAIAAGCIAAPR